MKKKLLFSVAVALSSCWADQTLVKQLLEATLADSRESVPPANDPAVLRFETAVQALTPNEIQSLLPLAMQCLKSGYPRPQEAGVTLLVATTQTAASAALLEPYLDYFDKILSSPTNPNRQSIIGILEITRPSMSPNVIRVFLRHLQDTSNTPLQTGAIAGAVLRAAPVNEAIVRQVLSSVEKRSEYEVKYSILQQIGLSKIQFPEALDFLGKQLEDPTARVDAIVAISRLDRGARARFAPQLSRIAQNPEQKPEIRKAAEAAINGQ
jgi:hypothetical protein